MKTVKDPAFWALNRSLPFDRRLYREDIEGSVAHARMLGRRGIVSPSESRRIARGLERILAELDAGTFRFRDSDEDIHMAVERRLIETIGPAGGKLHTGRSRNDQVALDLRLYLRRQVRALAGEILALEKMLIAQARRHARTLLPAYTHMQRGQATTLAHHLSAYAQMFARDLERLRDLLARIEVLPLGSGACTGTTFPIDRAFVARALKFRAVSGNSLDAVSDRDFALEFLGAAALVSLHLSRLGEEWVLWSGSEFRFVELPPELTSGSSMMPNKRNPDGAELLRAKAGRAIGNWTRLAAVLKGLPLAYNKDLQEDKEAVFDTVDTLMLILPCARRMVEGSRFNAQRMREAVQEGAGWIMATELADGLARRGVPFRQAHGITHAIVEEARRSGRSLTAYTPAELRRFTPKIDAALIRELDPWSAVTRRNLPGGPAPAAVARDLRALETKLRRLRKEIG